MEWAKVHSCWATWDETTKKDEWSRAIAIYERTTIVDEKPLRKPTWTYDRPRTWTRNEDLDMFIWPSILDVMMGLCEWTWACTVPWFHIVMLWFAPSKFWLVGVVVHDLLIRHTLDVMHCKKTLPRMSWKPFLKRMTHLKFALIWRKRVYANIFDMYKE